MEILTREQHRLLFFVHACSRSGYRPLIADVKSWIDEPVPRVTTRITEPGIVSLANLSNLLAIRLYGRRETEAEHFVDHALRMGWVKDDSGLGLTRLGEALLDDAERADEEQADAVVILESSDEFAYARLIGQIARLGESFLIDPYFRLAQFETIVHTTSVRRVLISKQYKGSKEARAELAVALAMVHKPTSIEIRSTSSDSLHDRLIVAENQDVFMLGASLGTIGVANTVFLKVPEIAASPLRQHVEDLWSSACPVMLPEGVAQKDGADDDPPLPASHSPAGHVN